MKFRGLMFVLALSFVQSATAGVWDTTTPLGSEPKSLGDDRIREMKVAIQEALQTGGVFPGSDPSTAPRFYPSISTGTTALRPTGNDAPAGRLYLNLSSGTLEMSQGGGLWNAMDVVGSSTIFSTDLAVEVAGPGIDGGGGVPLRVNVDSNTFTITSDTVTIKSDSLTSAMIKDGTITGSDVVTTTFTVTGPIRSTNQVAFSVRNTIDRDDVTGDGTVYTVPFDTEDYDVGNNISAGIFTAPSTGKYQFNACVEWEDAGVVNDAFLILATTSRNYISIDDNQDFGSKCISKVVLMTAGDTARINIELSNASKLVDILGGTIHGLSAPSGSVTFFDGYLLP